MPALSLKITQNIVENRPYMFQNITQRGITSINILLVTLH